MSEALSLRDLAFARLSPLACALLRVWWTREMAFAYARVCLNEAEASACPIKIRVWREAVRQLGTGYGFGQ